MIHLRHLMAIQNGGIAPSAASERQMALLIDPFHSGFIERAAWSRANLEHPGLCAEGASESMHAGNAIEYIIRTIGETK